VVESPHRLPTKDFKEGITMAVRPVTRLASAAVVTGVATLAFAAPASAIKPIEPAPDRESSSAGAGSVTPVPAPAPEGTSWDLLPVATGALGGVAVAGAAVAAAAGLRRHNLARPA
jgi:hypothetical protein